MNHDQAFLQAIREAPRDDAPRLIYADWLEEQGGAARTARAAFIRAQCRLAELPDDDPARDALKDEAEDVLAEYEGEWTQPLHGIVSDWSFSRGFVERITIGAEKWLTHAESFFDFAPLRCLHFLIHARDVPHLMACPYLQRIETLDFTGCHLNDRSLQQLLTSPYLEQLTALNLSGNGINTPGLRALVQSPLFLRLRLLDLSRNIAIGGNAIRLLAQANPDNHLEDLNLASTNLSLNGLHDLFQSRNLPHVKNLDVSRVSGRWVSQSNSLADYPIPAQLHTLNVSDSPLARVNLRPLLTFLSPENLRALSLANCFTEPTDLQWLTQLPALANLALLDLARNNLGAAGALALADSPHIASLTHLNLSHNNIRDTGAKVLAASTHLTRLQELNLDGNGIGGPGLKALAESANLDPLRKLCLANNFIGPDSVRALAESEHLRSVTWLDLSDAFLEEDSARVLASSADLAHLRTLVLKKNLLGDGGARALAESPHLARLATLDLNDNRIGKAGAEALARAAWRRMRSLDLRGNVFTEAQEALLRKCFGSAVQL